MKIEQQSIYDLLDGSSKIKIPFYQRPYIWNGDDVNELLKDIIKNEDKHYYVGAIIFKMVVDGGSSWLIIDGQQRISTFWLILKVLQENQKKLDKENSQKINYLIEKFKLETKDWEEGKNLTNIVQNIDCSHTKGFTESNYYNNYKIIKKFIENPENKFTPDEFYEKFKRLIVARIGLDFNMDEQNIYAQINSTGKELSAFDLIKNNLFHEIKVILEEQNLDKDFDKKLNFFFELTKFYKNDNNNKLKNELLRHFIAYKTQNLYKTETKIMYQEYMKMKKDYYVQDGVVDALKLYDDLCDFAAAYKFLKSKEEFSKYRFKDSFDIITNSFGTYAVLIVDIILKNSTRTRNNLKLQFDDSQIEEICNCFLIIENYRIRRQFCDNFSEKSITKYMPKLVSRINLVLKLVSKKKDLKTKIQYHHVLYYLLFIEANNLASNAIVKNSLPSYRAPNNSEFKIGFKEKNISHFEAFCKLFLIRLLEFDDKKTEFLFDKFTIEHVLPSNLEKWRDDGYFEEDGDGCDENEEDVDKVKNTIGNLSLSPNNSKLSNNIFKIKKEIMENIENYNFNKYIRKQDKWNTKTIAERTNFLYRRVMDDIWNFDELLNKETKDILDKLDLSKIRNIIIWCEKLGDISEEQLEAVLKNYLVNGYPSYKIEENIFKKDYLGSACKSIINYFIDDTHKRGSLNEKDFVDFYLSKKESINNFLTFVRK